MAENKKSDSVAPNQAQETHPAGDSTDAAHDKSSAPNLNTPAGLAKPNLPPPTSHETNGENKTKSCRENIKFFVEIFGVVGGLVGVCFLIGQYNEMVKATKATLESVKVSQGQLDEMKQSRAMDERAWVMEFEGVIEDFDKSKNLTDFRVKFRNTGKTPAINVSVFVNQTAFIESIPKIDERITAIPFAMVGSFQFAGKVAPGAEGSIGTIDKPLDDGAIQSINKGSPHYIYGTIWYDDIFEGHHWSQFCYQIRLSPHTEFLPIAIHNSCDDVEKNKAK